MKFADSFTSVDEGVLQGRKLTFFQSRQLATNKQLLGASSQKLVTKSWGVKYC